MNEEKSTESAVSPEQPEYGDATEIVETKEAPVKVEEPKGLSRRDALEIALAATKDEPKVKAPEVKEPVQKEIKETAPKKPETPQFQPPAELSADEKADFINSTPKQQQAFLRVFNSRQSKIEEIRREAAELQWAKDLAKEVTPFLKVRGDKEPPHSQIIRALKVVNDVDSNTKQAVAQILEAKGISVPEGFLDENPSVISDKLLQEKIAPLQEELKVVKDRLAQEDQAKTEQFLQSSWKSFESEKNASGMPKFPDLGNTESGMKLAANIGSLVNGVTEISKQFIARVQDRIPDCDFNRLLLEAYRFNGGRVDDSEAPRPKQSQETHIAKSRRAASSIPGRTAQGLSSNAPKKLGRREALALALEQLNSE